MPRFFFPVNFPSGSSSIRFQYSGLKCSARNCLLSYRFVDVPNSVYLPTLIYLCSSVASVGVGDASTGGGGVIGFSAAVTITGVD